MDWLYILQDPNTRWILFATSLLGLSSGIIGCFAYLRKQSLMGDALSHAALPGVCLAFMVTGTKSMLLFLIGALIAGILATVLIGYMTRNTRIKQDSALGITLSLFFGVGIVLLTQIQHSDSGNQSGLDQFLFGQAASMVQDDVYTMMAISALLVGICGIFFKEFKLLSFDPGFAKGIGLPVVLLDQLIMLLMVIAVVVGLQAVGVVLMAALLITPAVAARYWTEKLHAMIVISGVFGVLSGMIGTLLSTVVENMPTGPLIVLSATVIFVMSMLFAPKRGLAARAFLRASVRNNMMKTGVKKAGEGESL